MTIRGWMGSGMCGGDTGELKIQGNDLAFCVGSDWNSRLWASLEAASGRWELQPFWFALSDGEPLEMGRDNWLHLKHCHSLEECFEQLCADILIWTRQGLTARIQEWSIAPYVAAWDVESGGVVIAGDRCFKQSRWRRPIQVIPVFEQLVTR